MAEYRGKTEPIMPDYYADRGILARVDGMADIDQVTAAIARALERLGRRRGRLRLWLRSAVP